MTTPAISDKAQEIQSFSSKTMIVFSQLVAVLREVKYLETEEGKDLPIPEEAAKIFAAKEAFRKYVANLNLTEQWYNKVR